MITDDTVGSVPEIRGVPDFKLGMERTVWAAVNEKPASTIVRELTLGSSCPSPFQGRTVISNALPNTGNVSLVVYDASGRRVRTLIEGRQQPGSYRISWDGRDDRGGVVSHGVCFCTLSTSRLCLTRKIVVTGR